MPLESFAVWGKVEQVEPLIKDLVGVQITDAGFDCVEANEPVVELTYDTEKTNFSSVFGAVYPLEKQNEASIANGVGESIFQ